MASPSQIAATLLDFAAELSIGSPALPMALPDLAFTPPSDGKYLVAAVFFNRPAWEGLTTGRLDQGLLQITVVWPKNQGVILPLLMADEIVAAFPKAMRMAEGLKVSGQPYATSPIYDEGDTRVPVTIPWTA